MQATFQARPFLADSASEVLSAWSELYGRAERSVFAAWCAGGRDSKALERRKPEFCQRFGLTSRQFNALWMTLKGKIASKQECDKLAAAEVAADLKAVRASLKKLIRQKAPLSDRQRRSWAGKTRRLARLERRESELKAGRVALCFGSRKLFRAQFDRDACGYASHAEWRAAWRDARSCQFFLVGSKDETSGNQSCTATVADNGTLTLRLRLPEALIERNGGQKYLLVEGVWFEHGQVELYAALDAGQALSYRFLRDHKGWRVFVSTARPETETPADVQLGVVSVDINADHLAVTDVDRFGNLVSAFSVPCVTHGKTSEQRKDTVRCAGRVVLAYAARVGKPLVHERLDFSRRKQELTATSGSRYARMLSSFAYGGIIQSLQSNALKQGVPVLDVNPAYTSVIGRVKYAQPLGITVHQAAALAIGRRGMGFGEHVPARSVIPDGKGDHLVVELPARNRSAHEWTHWAKVRTKIQETLAGWHRLRKEALGAERAAKAASSASRGQSGVGVVRIHPSNRQHNRSADVSQNALA